MEKAFWAIRYFFLLSRKSILMPILVGMQFVVLYFAPQGRDVLKALSSEQNLGFQLIVFEISIILSGVLYFLGAYWLLFFSGTKGNLFEDPDNYPTSSLKIKAWKYQEFIQKYRGYLLRLYAGLLLFAPFFIQIISISFISFWSLKWILVCLSTLAFNILVLYLRANRNSFLVLSLKILTAGIARNTEAIFFTVKSWFKLLIVPAGELKSENLEIVTQFPISIDFKGKSLLQTFPAFRGGFYLLLYFGVLLVCFLLGAHRNVIEMLGPAAVIQFGLCFWSIFFIWMAYLNKVYFFPFYGFLLLFFIINSYYNSDHPILERPNVNNLILKKETLDLEKIMEKWLISRPLASIKTDTLSIDNIIYTKENPYKYLIINAEGGANRSGYWTALVLDSLRKKLGDQFDEHLFAFSTVSGGSMGALSYGVARETNSESNVSGCLKDFYKEDFLSALTNGLIVREIFGAFTPFYTEKFDRAVAFENSVDEKLRTHITPENRKNFSFNNLMFNPNDSGFNPLYLIHTTEVETGKKAILANENLELKSFSFGINLLQKLPFDISIGTAIHLGARFPVFSPSAAIKNVDGDVMHYVDGGYYENGGYETTNELVVAVRKSKLGPILKPIVITISNRKEANKVLEGAYFLNEIQSIIGTAAQIRSANLETHKRKLNEYLMYESKRRDSILEFNLNANSTEIPMNWFLTKTARNRVEDQVEKVFKEKSTILNPEVFWYTKKETVQNEEHEKEPDSSNIDIENGAKANSQKTIVINAKLAFVSPAQNPGLYYFSKSKKEWRLKSEADFNLGNLQPLKGKKIRYKKAIKRNSK